jgi:hypothetical protein
VTKEGNAAEHLLLADGSIASKSIADALSELLAVRHASTPRPNARIQPPPKAVGCDES